MGNLKTARVFVAEWGGVAAAAVFCVAIYALAFAIGVPAYQLLSGLMVKAMFGLMLVCVWRTFSDDEEDENG